MKDGAELKVIRSSGSEDGSASDGATLGQSAASSSRATSMDPDHLLSECRTLRETPDEAASETPINVPEHANIFKAGPLTIASFAQFACLEELYVGQFCYAVVLFSDVPRRMGGLCAQSSPAPHALPNPIR